MNSFNSLGPVLDRLGSLTQVMDDAFLGSGRLSAPLSRRSHFLVPMDWYETDSSYVIEADMPGVDPKEVEISFEQNVLAIRGSRALPGRNAAEGETRIYCAERLGGEFSRMISLPDAVDSDQIEATHSNGVLKVVVPKSAKALPRKITVKTES